MATNLLDQLPDLVSGQPAEPYQLGLPGQLGQERAGRMIADHHLHVAIRADNQRGGVMQLAGEEHEQPSDDTSAQCRSSMTASAPRALA
jgi:hypothetical protein